MPKTPKAQPPAKRFHVLPDFEKGKRSCWRKLERHNNIRKRKHVDKGEVASKQQQVNRTRGPTRITAAIVRVGIGHRVQGPRPTAVRPAKTQLKMVPRRDKWVAGGPNCHLYLQGM
ncbi:hypothetical protein F2Q69_00038006 [Brassica cretica]|uniref:SBP-type domain-containing protein n=1 Tax=Brassica cretica TaxID=69181 RepID=A0A8S9SMJ7_BRACR|nr:hypothetical protein F2Q69_00038006 [Brassica cretica]